jgi:RNA polymerase sigma factor (TIGR02999 family)
MRDNGGNKCGVDGPEEEPEQIESLSPGSREERERIFRELYAKLKPYAKRANLSRVSPTLSGTGLLNEAFLRLLNAKDLFSKPEDEIIRIFAHVMRQILVDRIRNKKTAKRGGGALHIPLDAGAPASSEPQSPGHPLNHETLLTIESALIDLESLRPLQARVIECRFYLGLTAEETAMVLGVAKTRVEREHRKALEFLNSKISPKHK